MGSASHSLSGGFAVSGSTVDNVEPWIANNLNRHQQCKLDDVLGEFLVRCRGPDKTTDRKKLLTSCMGDVVDVCNNLKLQESLKDYCTTKGDETDRYKPLVNACNAALSELTKLTESKSKTGKKPFADLRDPDELHILFHRNDPCMFHGQHDGTTSDRKPDIIITSLAAAQRVLPPEDIDRGWDDVVGASAFDAPGCVLDPETTERTRFHWPDVLSSWELKQVKKGLDEPLKYPHNGQPPYYPPKTNAMEEFPGPLDVSPQSVAEVKSSAEPTRKSARVGVKRSNDNASGSAQGRNSKRPKVESNSRPGETKQPRAEKSIVQCAQYGAEMLSRGPFVNHAINILIVDDVAWIWWYDKQGAIQTDGVNFIKDLPRFLVLLVAFQRFTLSDWGFNTTFDLQSIVSHQDAGEGNGTMPITRTFPNGATITIDPSRAIYTRYCLLGRGTSVLGATNEKELPKDPHAALPLAAKIYWPEESRTSEVEIICAASERGKGDDDVDGHFPELITWADFDQYSTRRIREAFHITENPNVLHPTTSRILRILVFPRYETSTKLVGEPFLKVWFDCVKCHYGLWRRGIQHSDPSLWNVMFAGTEEEPRGVLNDWDLATLDRQVPSRDRTGTIPFMALDLLTADYWEGKVKRLYRHDLEGLIWILPFVFTRYRDREIIANAPLETWMTGKYEACRAEKSDFLFRLGAARATVSYVEQWHMAVRILAWLTREAVARQDEDLAIMVDSEEQRDGGELFDEGESLAEVAGDAKFTEDFYTKFWEQVKIAAWKSKVPWERYVPAAYMQ